MAQRSPIMGGTKRSSSGSLMEPNIPIGLPGSDFPRQGRLGGDLPDVFIPMTEGEHLLEATYLGDVVKPLVRALVNARMTTPRRPQDGEQTNLFADLERLRHELQRSAQRRRNVERERDDLARRLDRVAGVDAELNRDPGGSSSTAADRGDRGAARRDLYVDPGSAAASTDPLASHYRSGFPGNSGGGSSFASPGMKPIGLQGDGPGIPVDGMSGAHTSVRSPQDSHLEPLYPGARASSPRSAHQAATSRQRSYAGLAQNERRGTYTSRGPPRLAPGPHGQPYDHVDPYTSGTFVDEGYPQPSSTRPGPRYSVGPYSAVSDAPPGSFVSPHPVHRTSTHNMGPYTSPHPTGLYNSGGPYDVSTHGDLEHEVDGIADGPRKHPKLHAGATAGEVPLRPASASDRIQNGLLPINGPPEPTYATTRKLAATKNRTCSNCAAPHDAKFRRGPNGPGTLCDRCGSRWKKYKENEAAMRNPAASEQGNDPTLQSHSARASESRSPPPGATNTGSSGASDPPQQRQRLPQHLAPGRATEPSHSPPGAGSRYAAAPDAGEPSSAVAAGTPLVAKREDAAQQGANHRREPSSSPDQLVD
ncbi:hypothetical protein ACQY0O_004643 [Thecaphora frezii]